MLQIPFLEYVEVRYFIGVFTLVMALIVTYRNFVVVFTGGIGKNGSTCAVSDVYRPLQYQQIRLLVTQLQCQVHIDLQP